MAQRDWEQILQYVSVAVENGSNIRQVAEYIGATRHSLHRHIGRWKRQQLKKYGKNSKKSVKGRRKAVLEMPGRNKDIQRWKSPVHQNLQQQKKPQRTDEPVQENGDRYSVPRTGQSSREKATASTI
jgi:transposase